MLLSSLKLSFFICKMGVAKEEPPRHLTGAREFCTQRAPLDNPTQTRDQKILVSLSVSLEVRTCPDPG